VQQPRARVDGLFKPVISSAQRIAPSSIGLPSFDCSPLGRDTERDAVRRTFGGKTQIFDPRSVVSHHWCTLAVASLDWTTVAGSISDHGVGLSVFCIQVGQLAVDGDAGQLKDPALLAVVSGADLFDSINGDLIWAGSMRPKLVVHRNALLVFSRRSLAAEVDLVALLSRSANPASFVAMTVSGRSLPSFQVRGTDAAFRMSPIESSAALALQSKDLLSRN